MANNYETIESIKQRYAELMAMWEDGEVDEETLLDTWEGIDGELENKADAIAYLVGNEQGLNKLREEEIKRLQHKIEVSNNLIERLKKMLWGMMETCERPKFKTAYHSFNIANNGGVRPLVFVGGEADINAIDERFVKTEVKKSTDNKAIREALDNGEDLGFVYYGERGRRLDIR